MNIIAARQEQRAHQIKDITASIEKAILKGKNIKYEELILSVMSNLNLSKRTAKDYIEVALFQAKLTKEDLIKS